MGLSGDYHISMPPGASERAVPLQSRWLDQISR